MPKKRRTTSGGGFEDGGYSGLIGTPFGATWEALYTQRSRLLGDALSGFFLGGPGALVLDADRRVLGFMPAYDVRASYPKHPKFAELVRAYHPKAEALVIVEPMPGCPVMFCIAPTCVVLLCGGRADPLEPAAPPVRLLRAPCPPAAPAAAAPLAAAAPSVPSERAPRAAACSAGGTPRVADEAASRPPGSGIEFSSKPQNLKTLNDFAARKEEIPGGSAKGAKCVSPNRSGQEDSGLLKAKLRNSESLDDPPITHVPPAPHPELKVSPCGHA